MPKVMIKITEIRFYERVVEMCDDEYECFLDEVESKGVDKTISSLMKFVPSHLRSEYKDGEYKVLEN